MHHPACWVTNGGCSTSGPHHSAPVAQAFGREPGTPSSTGSGFAPPERRSFTQTRPQREALADPDDEADVGEDDSVIGGSVPAAAAQPVRRGPAPPPAMSRPRAPRRYDDSGRDGAPRPLPKVYGQRRVIDFWYIPAAIIVAAIVAIGVVLGVEKLTGGSSNNKAATAPSTTATAAASTSATPSASVTARASTTPAAAVGTPGGPFTTGQKVTVTGTGECLNIRPGPSTSGSAIACVPDGTTATVTGGPQDAEGYTWWKVQTDKGEGWAAGDYLAASSAG